MTRRREKRDGTAGAIEVERLALLYELGCAFASRTEPEDLIAVVVEKSREVLHGEGIGLLLHDRERDELFIPYTAQTEPEIAERLRTIRIPRGRGIAWSVMISGRAERVDDPYSDPRFYPAVDRATGFVTRNMITAPLITREGTVGALQVVNRVGGKFDDRDLEFLVTLCGSIAVALDNARLFARLRDSKDRLHDEVGALRRDLARREFFGDIVGTSPGILGVLRLMESAASSPIAVLLEGETGTGKELVAQGIHRASARAQGLLRAVNCAALPETLLESELFGHRRGAFTGANRDRRGLFESTAGGTVFLDEIGEMPPAMQVKLLRVLQEGEVVPLGDTRPRKIDVRVISATNRNLEVEVAARRFREDLFFRLGAFPIRLPPLRDRREDIPALTAHFLAAAAERDRLPVRGIEPGALDRLVRFDWPGNVRELRNEVERAIALAGEGELIRVAHLSAKVQRVPDGAIAERKGAPRAAASTAPPTDSGRDLHAARQAFESAYVSRVLEQHDGNVSRAARALGLSRTMLHRKIRTLGLRREEPVSESSAARARTDA